MVEFIKRFITASILGAVFWYTFFYMPSIAFTLLLLGILLTILLFEWKNLFHMSDFWFWFIMPWYPILPFVLMMIMNNNEGYRCLLYYMFVLVFAFDGTAYLTGTLLGSHKIIPTISPGKTVEGCIGGFIGALLTFWIALKADRLHIPFLFFFSLTLITCFLAFAGDIFESFLKRSAKIKDSGTILPGHGGFLDRFDAVIFTTFFFFFFRHALTQYLCPGI
ncbi:phosphatidate cytidylyltransferase [Candidatus Babeliales bacterium]|nr:phosphatidate cytidylyltransferase [Candidatus Babeliales bacterium]